ncbi:hypothetical protein SAMN04487866_12217 [Thermoactinomyces sp. DSM 45891]|uniref:hypothetical protein n=1 Tax=Thermoactinomyces sp. DSM 45891 TaxID=1761907 RepID=UPI000914A770|nr:hypothetical protein [Thermoactinomyces sp. DSM 45891]SFX74788.1 hypothetical protein SAMN04487866_12217 [Thermoactinomyces sp. DSM 45891]
MYTTVFIFILIILALGIGIGNEWGFKGVIIASIAVFCFFMMLAVQAYYSGKMALALGLDIIDSFTIRILSFLLYLFIWYCLYILFKRKVSKVISQLFKTKQQKLLDEWKKKY